MTLNRRRFLTICAAFIGAPAYASGTQTWQGYALGADVTLTLRGPRELTNEALSLIPAMLAEIEGQFSLFDDHSQLSVLNRTGTLGSLDPRFAELLHAVDLGHDATGGLFDPTIQPLWQTVAQGGDTAAARASVGWDKVSWDRRQIRLGAGQALTFNGIAQGFATDLVTARLRDIGLTDALVNIGEYSTLGGPWRLGLSDPTFGLMGTRTIDGNAIATSSPSTMMLGDQAHILHPTGRVQWSTVSVEADTATQADCLSTALCLAPRSLIEHVRAMDGVHHITLVDQDGNLSSL